MLVILCLVLIRENVVINIYLNFKIKSFSGKIFSENNHWKVFSKKALLQLWSKSFKNKEWNSSFFSIVAGPTCETLTTKLNSFTSIYFSFKVFKSNGRAAILQISFLERKYFGIYMGVEKHLMKCVNAERVQSFLKTFNFPSV